MIDARDYDGVANYFIKLKNDALTIKSAEKPYIKGNTLYLPNSLTEISEESFAHDVNIQYVVIPDSVVSIADNAFEGIENLTIVANETSYAYSWALNNGFAVSDILSHEDQFTVAITADNFFDYFEFVVLPYYNSFGELQENRFRLGVRSKLYDMGYVIREVSDITLEVTITTGDFSRTQEISLNGLLTFGLVYQGFPEVRLNRMIPNELSYVDTSLVKSYVLGTKSGYDRYHAEIVFKDTTYITYGRTVIDGYLY